MMGPNKLRSSLFTFGSSFFSTKSRGKIQTQPSIRRKSQNKSRQKQDNRGDSTKRALKDKSQLPLRRITTTRKHHLAGVVANNLPSAKKSGSHKMISCTRYPNISKNLLL